jgi:hypothetical protein
MFFYSLCHVPAFPPGEKSFKPVLFS